MKKMISIGKAADLLGVAISTLREWDHEGKLIPVKTFGKHRRYLTVDILRMQGKEKLCDCGCAECCQIDKLVDSNENQVATNGVIM